MLQFTSTPQSAATKFEMENFLLKCFRKIRKDAPRRFTDLRRICDENIASLMEKENAEVQPDTNGDKYFDPLRLACETRQSRLMEVALDAIHFLIERGFMKGNTVIAVDNISPDSKESKPRILIDSIVETVSKCSDDSDENVQLQVIKALLTAITSIQCQVHEASLLLSVRACFHIHLISKNPVNKTTAKAALTQMLSVVNQRMEMYESSNEKNGRSSVDGATLIKPVTADSAGEDLSTGDDVPEERAIAVCVTSENTLAVSEIKDNSQHEFSSIYQRDSYLLFRALCKLSMKGLNEEGSSIQSANDPIALQNKALSLELILHILQHSGPAFQSGDKFIYAIRQYLCVSLLSNCTSQVAQVTGLSLMIFGVLMDHFKDHLKSELEVFISSIFLRILDSENSTFDHKYKVLDVFHTICKDPSAQLELFINYDCDLDAINLFSKIVDGFAKIAKNPNLSSSSRGAVDFISSGKRATSEDQQIRAMGLEGLVHILRSLEQSSCLTTPHSSIAMKPAGESYIANIMVDAVTATAPGSSAVAEAASLEINDTDISATNSVQVFGKKQKMQEELDTGILRFNMSPKQGIEYLSRLGHLDSTSPKAIAAFFMQYHDRLDKTLLGDYLGREREYQNGFCIKVLHEYTEMLDFKGMDFDLAIRHFLSGFRLPGEAQKIDRIMEKFAERYFLQNRDTFASADMAFILAFSTIMLQTNLHNPAIKDDKRMTKEQFIKQNKGISADGELPDAMLSEIYDRIAAAPISIIDNDKCSRRPKKEEQSSSFVVFQATTDKRKKDAYKHERKEMVKAGEAMIKHSSTRRGTVFVRTSTMDDEPYVKPMFDIVWPPLIGVLSQLLETYDDPLMVQLCLSGFQHGIRLACRFDFPTARNTFISALIKFTTLDSIREMRYKHVLCTKLMLNIGLLEADYLEESWTQLLQCVSQLARLQMIATGSHTDEMFFGETNSQHSSDHEAGASGNFFRRASSARGFGIDRSGPGGGSGGVADSITKFFSGTSRAEAARQQEEINADLINRDITPEEIDRLYLNSTSLSNESVTHFVRSLCRVSFLEINISSSMNSLRGKDATSDLATPRIFSLQKLVEVADYNMHTRSRVEWANIWKLLADHFSMVGLHENHFLAMYAIDSLKQLSIKFLQKDELSNFNFQRLFLKPFENIIAKTKYVETKDLILRCIDIMIRACVNNIHSGWRSIFSIFEVAASQDNIEVASMAFEIIERLMVNSFDVLIFDFVELMNCLVTFSSSTHTSLSLKSLDYLASCADHLAGGTVAKALNSRNIDVARRMSLSGGSGGVTAADISDEVVAVDGNGEEDGTVFRLWWPLLLGLSTRVGDPRLQLRVKALDTLLGVLRSYGHLFSPQTWSMIFKGVLFPIMDSAKTDSTAQPKSAWPTENPPASQNRQSWIGTMGVSVLKACIEMYQLFKAGESTAPLLPDLIGMLEGCICQNTESLAKLGLRALHDLLVSLNESESEQESKTPKLSPKTADLICSRVCQVMLTTFCLSFGELGSVNVQDNDDIPLKVKENFKECPLIVRRRTKDGISSQQQTVYASSAEASSFVGTTVGLMVITAYGKGKIEALCQPVASLDVGKRQMISLGWGQLYSTQDSFVTAEEIELKMVMENALSGSNPPKSREQILKHTLSAAMTSMVLSNDFIRLVDDLLCVHAKTWTSKHYKLFLTALESSHWYAFSFNANIPLRIKLQQKGFMNKNRSTTNLSASLPHLMEQEVLSAEQLLKQSFAMYKSVGTDVIDPHRVLLAREWVERITLTVLVRYLTLEEQKFTESRSNLPDDDSSDEGDFRNENTSGVLTMDLFAQERHSAYQVSIVFVLNEILCFSDEQFSDNSRWIIPLLSRLIICADIDVRIFVRDIYKRFVNDMALR